MKLRTLANLSPVGRTVVGQALRLLCLLIGRRCACPTIFLLAIAFCANAGEPITRVRTDIAKAQVPTWTKDDMNFFLHGSMSTEVVPEAVLRAFIKTYPDLFPSWDLTHLGLIPDKDFGWPIGLSRKKVQHLGNMSAVGINCASCHVAQIESVSTKQPIRMLGVTSHFNVEGFFGSVLVSTFKTADPL